jgi:hypothetical protein
MVVDQVDPILGIGAADLWRSSVPVFLSHKLHRLVL